jgi:hypothetical protein
VNRWRTAWNLIKDVGLTGTGIFVIVLQAFSAKPNGLLLGTGLALTVPSVAEHVRALLPSSGGGSSSPQSELPGPPPSSLPPGGTSGEHPRAR